MCHCEDPALDAGEEAISGILPMEEKQYYVYT
jgi:hypothetical protein